MTVKELVAKTCKYSGSKDYYDEVIGDTLYIYFHASHTFQDWVRNFFFWTIKIKNNRIHMGYYKEWFEMWNIELLTKIIHYKKRVFVGYSRGAALALITVWCLHLSGDYTANDKTVIIGAPRVFRANPNFWLTVIPNVIEVCYGNDIVRKLLFWYTENPCTKFVHIPSTVPGWFKACKDHGQYTTVDVDVEV